MPIKRGSTDVSFRVGSTAVSRIHRGASEMWGNYLLDQYGAAAAAYSLRRLSSSYTGPVVQVRRSGDNAEANFTAAEVSDGTLAAWVGAGNDGFVKTWYDQSGNARNVSQSTSTLQPQLVSVGAVLTLNSKPAIDWPAATANKVMTGTISTSSAISTLAVFSAVKRSGGYGKIYNLGVDDSTSGYALTPIVGATVTPPNGDWTDGNTGFFGNGFQAGRNPRIQTTGSPITSSSTKQNMLFAVISSAVSRMFVNNSEVSYSTNTTGNSNTLSNVVLYLGNNEASVQQHIGRMQEVIIWTIDIFASRAGVQSNTSSYYGIP